ncbi:helix-turn-helix transcriptional regulator [Oceanobacillus picturae]|uniref:helix-turn-helix transcriptional regulator n=1 Tax=Oceanobacillus picturae TaxID=171693 RepID=UPI003626C2E7
MFYVGFYQPRDSVKETVAKMEEHHDIPVMIGSINVLIKCCSLVFLDLQKLNPQNSIAITRELARENVKVIGLITGVEEPRYLLQLVRAGIISLIEDHSLSSLVKGAYVAQKDHSILPPTLLQFLRENIVEMSQLCKEAFAHKLLKSGINLTPKEIEIAYLLGKDLRNRDIAYLLNAKETTVKVHISHIYTKTGMKRRRELIQYFKELKYKEKGACS